MFGYLEAPTGLGQAARAGVLALKAVGIPVASVPVTEDELSACWQRGSRAPVAQPYAINWCHVNASRAGHLPKVFGAAAFLGRFNIGYWAWELDKLPRTWDLAFRYYDEIWVPSTFTRKAVEERSPVPVCRVPHPVVPPPIEHDARSCFGIPADCTAFLCRFDMRGAPERKNPLAAICAFRLACSDRRDASLVLKVGGLGHNMSYWNRLRAELQGVNHLIIERRLDTSEMWNLISSCDALISLHRSEAFGLVMAEAMALGKPVIATAYSGNTDFMTHENSLLVDYRLVRILRHTEPFPAGYRWAEPDIEHAAAHIRTVIEHPDRAKEVGVRAARHIAEHLSPAVVGKTIRSRLEELGFVF